MVYIAVLMREHRKQDFLLWMLSIFLALGWMQGCGILSFNAQDRTFSQTLDDNAIRLKISQELLLHDSKALDGVEVLVYRGVVVLVGSVSNPGLKTEAGKLAEQVSSVSKVWNELCIGEESFTDYLSDGLMEKKIKASFIMDGRIRVENYNLRVFKGILYVLGSASGPEELKRLKYHVDQFSLRDAKYFVTFSSSKDTKK
ncbi:BON domain-containing protein [Holospora curviuscula]|uniref:Outer membrane lipoprotein n=1 Tax=Holospora curviuscula TaxID=1082868 RepID=A0A2S5R8G4_9PROT|nr:BON domain-containing protein [Holospora curviuscula]PPE03608.1 outer membrane lipoprotein [Holospora curviuscula]